MDLPRSARAPGSTLTLGGVEYRLEAVEGCGSSAIVYRAVYSDSLNRDALHEVYLKELFPISPHGEIRRDENGDVVCLEAGRDAFETARRRFRLGNQINLELLRQSPAATAGNLNSFEAHGTYYSVLSVHGGQTLLRLLEARGRLPLREAAETLLRLLRALEGFHSRGLLHLDISPDNVLLLPEQALLIDFNSVWDTNSPDAGDFVFSCKQGYSAPEVLLQNAADIGPATDLYACCAVFFHMLSGRRLTDEELSGGLRRAVAELFREPEGVPQTAASKAAELLLRGLHTLPRKRYQDIAALREDARELLLRIDGCGVTPSALWEAGAAACRARRKPASDYLAQPVRSGGEVLDRAALEGLLSGGARALLTGPGGMGKTRLLCELEARHSQSYRPGAPVFFYISLRDYQAAGAESGFLRRAMLRALRFGPEEEGYDGALHALEALFDTRGGAVSVVLLLDGLNEAGPHREPLLREIELLAEKPGLGLLVTERTPAVLEYALPGFAPMELSPLTQAQVSAQCAQRGVPLPPGEGLRQLLTTPMLLFLYLESAKMPDGGEAAPPETQEALISAYLERFCRQTLREDSGSQADQLIDGYALRHLLPAIAGEMRRQDRTALPVEAVRALSRRSYQALRGRSFGAAFPEYLGKSRLMLSGLGGADEWYDLAVRERLLDRFGLLSQTEQGQLALLHDAFLPVLAEEAEANRRQERGRANKLWRRRIAAGAAALLIIAGAGAAGAKYLRSRTEYTAAEEGQIYDALTDLSAALGAWSSRVSSQTELLDRAELSDVLDNQDAWAREELAGLIEQKRAFLAALYVPAREEADWAQLEAIAGAKPLFSPEAMEELYDECAALAPLSEAAMAHLEAALCEADSVYSTRDKRERVVNAYREYLEAETRYVSYLLAALLADMTPEQQAELLEPMTYMEALDGFYDGPGSVAPERLADGTDRAREAVKAARLEMLAQGFELADEG